jgi:hypothetical protein
VNGGSGVIVTVGGQSVVVMRFTVAGGRIVEIDAIADRDRVRAVTAGVLTED